MCGTREIRELIDYEAFCGVKTMEEDQSISDVAPRDLAERIERGDDLQLIDVREEWEWKLGNIPGARLMPGSSVTVQLGAERRRVVAMPRDAVAEEGFALVWADGRSTLRAVTLGAELGDGRVEVVSGLAPGETVVRSGR